MQGMLAGAALVSVRGRADNNMFTIGGSFENFALLMHFNGRTWYEYVQLPADFDYQAIAVSEQMVVAVGLTLSGLWADKASVVTGRGTR